VSNLPLLTRVTLAFAAGLLVAYHAPAPVALPAAAAAALLLPLAAGRARAPLLPLLAFLLLGIHAGTGSARQAAADCRQHIPDGARLQVFGTFESLAVAGAATVFRADSLRVAGRRLDCRGGVRALPPRAASAPVGAGVPVVAWGRWWAIPSERASPRRPERAGTLSLDSLRVRDGQPLRRVQRARGAAQERIRRLYGDRAPVAEALLLARSTALDPDLRDRFARAGLSHLLAISGLHVGLIAGGLLLLGNLLRLPRRRAALLAAGATVAYVGFLGAPHAASRAALQVVLLLSARMLQRPARPFALLAAAALILLALDPLAILDAGFQLSFAGAAGLVALRQQLQTALPTSLGRYLRDGLVTSIAATAATAPIAALHFGLVAPAGILANFAAVPLTALAVPAMVLSIAASALSWDLALLLAGGADLILALLEATASLAAALPAGHALVHRDAVLASLGATAVFLLLRRQLHAAAPPPGRPSQRRHSTLRFTLAAAPALALFLAWPAALRFGAGAVLEIHAIDVGQGDAFAIRSPAGRWILVDAGPASDRFDAGRARVIPYLLRRGANRLEAMVLTHPDADHIGGAASIIRALDVRAVIDPALPAGKPLYLDLLHTAAGRNIRWIPGRSGQQFHFDGALLTVLYPDSLALLDANGHWNDLSVVFKLEYGAFAALFLGDAPAAVEEALARAHGAELRADVLKVGHHGSRTSTSEALLESARPAIALIGVGRRNRYGHPDGGVLDRLSAYDVRVLRTDMRGAIVVKARRDGITQVVTTR
jgi:competence protein ComEC